MAMQIAKLSTWLPAVMSADNEKPPVSAFQMPTNDADTPIGKKPTKREIRSDAEMSARSQLSGRDRKFE